MTTIELTEEDVELFKTFRKYQDQFKILLDAEVFNDYTGSKTIHKSGKDIRMIDTSFIKRF